MATAQEPVDGCRPQPTRAVDGQALTLKALHASVPAAADIAAEV